MTTLQTALLAAAERETAFVQFYERSGKTEVISCTDILRGAYRRSLQLRERGLRTGTAVALIQSTTPELVRDIFAVLLAGAVPYCLAPRRLSRSASYARDVARMIRSVDGSHYITDENHRKYIAPEFSGPDANGATGEPPCWLDTTLWESWPGPLPPGFRNEVHLGVATDAALIQFSSGTTGHPRPIVLSQRAILSNVRTILSSFPGAVSQYSGLSWLPLHHDMGLIGCLFSAIVHALPITLLKPEDFAARPLLWLRALTDTRANVSPAPNFALQHCIDRIRPADLENLNLEAWDLALIGAEFIHPRVLEDFSNKFAPVGFRRTALTPVYGLAEATLAVAFSAIETELNITPFDPEALACNRAERNEDGYRLVSVGKPLPGVQIEIRGGNGKSLPAGELGDIFVKSPALMDGTYQDWRAGLAPPECLDTGDLGFFFQDELYIYGRRKDIIILNAQNYDPSFFEAPIQMTAGLECRRAAAFAVIVEDHESFEIAAERKRGDARDPELLAQAVREAVSRETGLIPHRVHIFEIGSLPQTTSGKIKRSLTAKQVASGEITALVSV